MVVFSLAALLVACIAGSPVIAADGVVLPSDSGVVAYLEKVSSRFPRVDGLGDVGTSQWVSLAYDAARQRLLIADYHYDELLVVNKEGQVEAVLANSSTATIPAPWMMDCHDIAVDSLGNIYLVDVVNKSVWILDCDLKWLGAVPIPPDTNSGFPECVAIDSRDRVIVGDWRTFGKSGILVYTQGEQSGQLNLEASFQFNPPDEQPYCRTPLDVVVDSGDRIIVAEGSDPFGQRERVLVFDKEFRWVATFGSAGSEPGQFSSIGSLAIGPKDTIIVSDDTHWSTVSFFFKNGTYAGRVGGHQQSDLSYPRALLTISGRLLVGDSEGLKEFDVDWTSLGGGQPVPELPWTAVLLLGGMACVLATRRYAANLTTDATRWYYRPEVWRSG